MKEQENNVIHFVAEINKLINKNLYIKLKQRLTI